MRQSRPSPGLQQTLRSLDQYYARLLDCEQEQLHEGRWTILDRGPTEDSVTRAFGIRQVLYLLAPLYSVGGRPSGVASLAPELRAQIAELLETTDPATLYQDLPRLRTLSRRVRQNVHPIAPGSSSRLAVHYATEETYIRYYGPWCDWIEPLEKNREADPYGLALLINYTGGVFVARIHDAIAAYIGLHAYSKRVWELTLPRLTPYVRANQTDVINDSNHLLTALLARATRAAFAAGAIPICTAPGGDERWRQMLEAVGYDQYANASVYAATLA